jgi:putative phage-type endonuclease
MNVINNLLAIPQHVQRSDEWFQQRENMLTSSDAATVLDINPYQKSHEVLFKKCGYDPKPFIGNVATLHGQRYEDYAIDKYCRVTGSKNYNFGLIGYDQVVRDNYDETYSFLGGSPDGIVLTQDNDVILLEVKCPYRRKIILNKCPAQYYPQVQLNLFIANLKIADFIEYVPESAHQSEQLNIVRIHRNDNWLSENLPKLRDFWVDVTYYREVGIEHHPLYPRSKQKIVIN